MTAQTQAPAAPPSPVDRGPREPTDDFRLDVWAARPPHLEVLATGPQATIQDLGRSGLAELGVGRSGAADPPSLRLANRLVGNPETHAAIEITFGGFAVRFTRAALISITGAPCPITLRNSPRPNKAGMCAPLHVYAGTELYLGTPARGMRSYLSVQGGIAVPSVLGSRASDTLARLGPPPLEPGSLLRIGEQSHDYPLVDLAPQPTHPEQPVLRALPGPRDHWFTGEALAALSHRGGYEVTAESNRVGMRLQGPALPRRDQRELPPEPTVAGALQVPPTGQPILFLADHPVTGGYPVIAVVHRDDLPRAAQTRPGQRIRFVLDRSS